ncbi:hypothetical protein JCM6882_003358 [Rhodosporidiobolus microsporus]
MELCVACCATLNASHGLSEKALPSHTEKSEPPPTTFPCGHTACGACVRKRRRLGQSCILCSTAQDVLGGGASAPSSSSTSLNSSRGRRPPAYAAPPPAPAAQDEGDFVLGGDSDEEDADEDGKDEPLTPPPEEEWGDLPPAYGEDGVVRQVDGKRKREQPGLHYLKPEETLGGLALRYGVPGHVLCTLNKLPISTLSTTPHFLHTLPFLLLPPGSRPSTSTAPLLPAPLERKRLLVRRFQMATKCADWAMAQAYVDQVFKAREEEARFVAENRRARGETVLDVEPREGGELEEAVEAFQRDERWEREQQTLGKGKGKGVYGSKMRTTGQVEGKVRKGWGWR